jgi:hypothetical protein
MDGIHGTIGIHGITGTIITIIITTGITGGRFIHCN